MIALKKQKTIKKCGKTSKVCNITDIKVCDICHKRKGEEKIKVVPLTFDRGGGCHLNFCKECWEKEYPNIPWKQVEDDTEYIKEAKNKAKELLFDNE